MKNARNKEIVFYLFNVRDRKSAVTQHSNTSDTMNPQWPDILIFTGVIHKEGDTSDSNTSDTMNHQWPDILIFTGVIHKEGDHQWQ